MATSNSDAGEYEFMTVPNALVNCRLSADGKDVELFGNRTGLLSLANIFLWFIANAWRREFLSMGELPFVRLSGPMSLCIRLAEDEATSLYGELKRQDRGESFEWYITEQALQQVALLVHRIVSQPGHEYDRLQMAATSARGVHIRMTEAAEWVSKGIA